MRSLETGTEYHLYMVLESDGVTASEVLDVSFTHGAGSDYPFGTAHSGVVLAPNPVSDTLFVRVPTRATASLYTLSGELVGRYGLESGHNTLSFADLNAGLYLVRLVFGGEEHLHRVVKE